jgi:protein N-terminal amidase
LKYECVVTVGYPEKVETERWPASPEYYNSAIIVNKDGETIANYRKTFLYSRDEAWALEGPNGFFHGVIPSLGTAAMGICKCLAIQFATKGL